MSKYIRKTEDEYEIHGFYYGTWEVETVESTREDAKRCLKEYRENCPEYSYRLIKKRVKKSIEEHIK